ncbi:MAG: hypothetical protein JXB39_12415 [Deltaproteobacteria bacterium]|nr:hypothetical protein [Deltaproteobacteria bacterium]
MPDMEPRQTVQVRVQVVDLRSFTLDLVVPTYLPARDLTHRIARDAGLESHWPDGRRHLYWLRARGRLLGDDEKLGDLGIVDGELVYFLPEPPLGSGVVEQTPDYPQTHSYAGRGIWALLASIVGVCAWSLAWGVALSVDRSLLVVTLPGLGLGFLVTSLARHAWGGHGARARVVATGLGLFVALACLAVAVPVFLEGEPIGALFAQLIPGLIAGFIGVLLGWLAWWGAVEPLSETPRTSPAAAAEASGQAAALVACAICGMPVAPEVRQECPHGCGRVFHVGCWQARASVYRGDPGICAICGQPIAR